jgi:hypothetical protein
MKAQQRELRKTNRELERDRGGLERQERQLVRIRGESVRNGWTSRNVCSYKSVGS